MSLQNYLFWIDWNQCISLCLPMQSSHHYWILHDIALLTLFSDRFATLLVCNSSYGVRGTNRQGTNLTTCTQTKTGFFPTFILCGRMKDITRKKKLGPLYWVVMSFRSVMSPKYKCHLSSFLYVGTGGKYTAALLQFRDVTHELKGKADQQSIEAWITATHVLFSAAKKRVWMLAGYTEKLLITYKSRTPWAKSTGEELLWHLF